VCQKKISEELVRKYIAKHFFEDRYTINEDRQPHFWEAVVQLCENPEKDVSNLINKNDICLIDQTVFKRPFRHVSCFDSSLETPLKLAQKIADEIIKIESMPICNSEFLLIKEKLDRMETRLGYAEVGGMRCK
jgi:hypothetical protein